MERGLVTLIGMSIAYAGVVPGHGAGLVVLAQAPGRQGEGPMTPIPVPANRRSAGRSGRWSFPALLFAVAFVATFLLYRHFARQTGGRSRAAADASAFACCSLCSPPRSPPPSGSGRPRRSVHRHRRPRAHLPRRHAALRHGPAQPRHPPRGLGRLLGLSLQRRRRLRLLAHPPQRHRHPRLRRHPVHADRPASRCSTTATAATPTRATPRASTRRPSGPSPAGTRSSWPTTASRRADRHRAHRSAPLPLPAGRPGPRRSSTWPTGTSVLDSSLRVVDDQEIEGFRRSTGWAEDQVVLLRGPLLAAVRQAARARRPRVGRARSRAEPEGVLSFGDAGGELLVKVGISAVDVAGRAAQPRRRAAGLGLRRRARRGARAPGTRRWAASRSRAAATEQRDDLLHGALPQPAGAQSLLRRGRSLPRDGRRDPPGRAIAGTTPSSRCGTPSAPPIRCTR